MHDAAPTALRATADPSAVASTVAVTAEACAHRPLTLSRKLLYGAGEVVVGTRMAAMGMVLFPFYTDVALLSPTMVGAALAIGRVWDGLNDPITGWLSDRTRTRFGRRRPFLGLMILPLAICFAALWMPPAGSTNQVFLYLVGALFLLDVFFGF
jgi:GPH family glycoside/pentoside/hexuronide:cation symporter